MPWLAILKLGLQVIEAIASTIRDKQLMDAGEQAAVAKQLAGINVAIGLAKQVADETAKMTDQQVAEDLKKHGELRD